MLSLSFPDNHEHHHYHELQKMKTPGVFITDDDERDGRAWKDERI